MSASRQRLLILGTSGRAQEVLWIATEIPLEHRDWDPGGFLDDDIEAGRRRLQSRGIALPVVGTINEYLPEPGDVFLAGIGDPRGRLECAARLEARGARFVNVIHPSAHISPSAQLGQGIFMFFGAVVNSGAIVGDHVAIGCYAGVAHGTVTGAGCTLSSHVDVTGDAHLGRGVFLGSHAVVLPKARVGDFAVVGAGSVAMGSVPPAVTVLGVPARTLRLSAATQ